MDRKCGVVLSALCFAACMRADPALAGALDNSFVGIRAIAMAGAFTGIANDASAVSYNPAGLAFLASGATHLEVYGYLSLTTFRYENAGALFESDEKFPVPGLFAAHGFDRLALGFGYYIPYGGGGTAYPDFMGTGIELKSAAGIQAFTASAAYKITPESVGRRGRVDVRRGRRHPGAPDDQPTGARARGLREPVQRTLRLRVEPRPSLQADGRPERRRHRHQPFQRPDGR